MDFLTSEYISLLKEDRELDSLIIDILISKKIIPLSKPQKGRQYGVDISAIGKDSDNVEKLFLITVKQGDITRSVWDSNTNAVRQSIIEIIETYISISLTSEQKKLPKKIIVATNGDLQQNVQTTWAKFIEKYEEKDLEFSFWGLDYIAKLVSENLLSERLFNNEMRLLLKKTLAFLEVKDYDLRHFKNLIGLILDKPIKSKKPLLKRLKLVQICLNMVFKWSDESGYLKSALLASNITILKTFKWLCEQNHFNKQFIYSEFFNIHTLRRRIGIAYFNKVNEHYLVEHSIQRYSKNQIEYSLTIWEEIGVIATIGLTEITHFLFHYNPNDPSAAKIYDDGANTIAETLINLIEKNPPSRYPLYDDHLIDIEPALRFLYLCGFKNECKIWLKKIIVGIHDAKILKDFFPLFGKDYENLVDYYIGLKNQDEKSSMLISLLADWCVILDDSESYKSLKSIFELFDKPPNIQIWFPKEETEDYYLDSSYSKKSGKVKHSILLYDKMKEYQKEIKEEVELFSAEKKFYSNKIHYDLIFTISSHNYKELPFPYFWRKLLK